MKNSIKKKHKLHQNAKQTQASEDWDQFKLYKSKLQKELRNAHWSYVNESLSKSMEDGNNKSFWKYIKSKRTDNVGVSGLKSNGKLYQDSQSKAEILNNQFKSVFTKEDPKERNPELSEPCYPEITELNITIPGVEKLLKALNVNKASGPDSIPNKVLRHCSEELATAVTRIFQLSLSTGILPTDWRNANSTPIFNKSTALRVQTAHLFSF